jgi:hypothetical protein
LLGFFHFFVAAKALVIQSVLLECSGVRDEDFTGMFSAFFGDVGALAHQGACLVLCSCSLSGM